MVPETVWNIAVAGVGGQGNVLASKVSATAGVHAGLFAAVGETFGASQRGGSVVSQVRLFRDKRLGPLIPAGAAHVIIGLEPLEGVRCLRKFGNPGTVVLLGDHSVPPPGLAPGEYPAPETLVEEARNKAARVFSVPALKLALEAGSARAANMVLLGAAAGVGILPLELDHFRAALREILPSRHQAVNQAALEAGFAAVAAEAGM